MTRDKLIKATRAMVRQMGGPTYSYGSVEIIANLTVALYERDRLFKVAEAAYAVRDNTTLSDISHPALTGKVLVPAELTDALNESLNALEQWRTP